MHCSRRMWTMTCFCYSCRNLGPAESHGGPMAISSSIWLQAALLTVVSVRCVGPVGVIGLKVSQAALVNVVLVHQFINASISVAYCKQSRFQLEPHRPFVSLASSSSISYAGQWRPGQPPSCTHRPPRYALSRRQPSPQGGDEDGSRHQQLFDKAQPFRNTRAETQVMKECRLSVQHAVP